MDDSLKRVREKGRDEGALNAVTNVRQHNGLIHELCFVGDFDRTREKDSEEPLPKAAETILLAEDDDTVLEVCKSILERQGYPVLAARTPTEALSLANDYPGEIHLLITDVILPEMSGGELAEKLQMSRPKVKCLFMSGYVEEFISNRGVLPEGVTFLQKPFSTKLLGQKVREALESR